MVIRQTKVTLGMYLVHVPFCQRVGNQNCCMFGSFLELIHREVGVKVGGYQCSGKEPIPNMHIAHIDFQITHLIVCDSCGFIVRGKSIRGGNVL